jgi:broad specificity phosphatase PhoE
MARQGYLRRLVRFVRGWIFVLWIYTIVGWRFWRWRLQLWFQRSHSAESTYRGMKQTLLLIRHGQTTWNVEHRLPGQVPGVALNDVGRQQATRLADALTVLPISAIISSPLERARETAEIIDQGRGLPIQLEPDLMDVEMGRWVGQVFDNLAKTDPDWTAYVKDPTKAPEGIETFPQVQQRAVAAVERWLKKDSIGDYPAFVCHADVVKLILAHYLGLEAGLAGRLYIDNASVSMVELEGEHRPRVFAVGWNPHPGWLKPPAPATEQPTSEEQQEGEQKA